MKALLEEFNRLTKEKSSWWQDDPKDFIQRFLDGRTQILPSELSDFGRAWRLASEHEEQLFEEHLRQLHRVMADRPEGELVYLMAYLRPGQDSSHVTLLGPVLFPNTEILRLFTVELKELLRRQEQFAVTLGDATQLKGGRLGFQLQLSGHLTELHLRLYELAKSFGAVLPEEHYAGEHYHPHVTDHGYGLAIGDSFAVKRVSLSLHPGARINIPHAYEIANLSLSS